jgi:NADPH:quinone reductase-like Zn-dependent oxidoreductase
MSRWKEENYKGSEFAKMLLKLIEMIRRGELKPPSTQMYPLSDYKAAIEQSLVSYHTKKILFKAE